MSGRMIAFVAALLAVAAPAAVEIMLEPVEVRVRNTAGGPRVFVDARTRLRLHLVPPGRETDLSGKLPRTADGALEVSLSKISAPLVHSLAVRAGLKPRLKADEVGKAAVWSGFGLMAVQSLSEGFRDFRKGEVRFCGDSSSCHLQSHMIQ